jgi:hypothetical protein
MNDKITDIRAKKITQMPDLNNTDWENIWVLLGYNDGDNVANYKVNMLQLAQNLLETGLINPSGIMHYISYAGLQHITSPSAIQFEGRVFTVVLVPDAGYELPDTIEVDGATIVTYNKVTGALKIDAGYNDGMINIIGSANYIEYTLGINIINGTYENINPKETYHINDELTIILTAIDQDHYDVPDINELGLQGLAVLDYNKSQGYTGTLRVKFDGTGNGIISGSTKRIKIYYFGYSIAGDNILNYDENNIPTSPGNRFTFLSKGRNKCPINFEQGFDYGNGIEYIPDPDALDDNVYIIVPKGALDDNGNTVGQYYIKNGNIFKDDNNVGWVMLAGNSSFERQVQYTEEAEPKPIIYETNYEEVNYYILCISTEGIQGHQSFNSIGNVAQRIVGIKWNSDVPERIAAGTTVSIPRGNISVIFGDGHEETQEDGFTISYNGEIGNYNNNTYAAPPLAEMDDEVVILKFTCTYQGMTDVKQVILYVPGDDDNLVRIIYDDVIPAIEYNKTYTLYKNKVKGINEDDSTYVISKPEKLIFTCTYGTLTDNEDGTLTYTAPFRQIDIQETINITYKSSYMTNVRFTVLSPDFHQIVWPTQLPNAIYDNETLQLDVTLYKVMDSDGSYQKITTDLEDIIITVTKGSINSTYLYNPSYNEALEPEHSAINPVASELEVTFTLQYKHCQAVKKMYVRHGNTPASTPNFYWYCGQYCPSSLTNPENDLANYNTDPKSPGWRQLHNAVSSYRVPNTAFDGVVQFYKGYIAPVEYYVTLPDDMGLFDSSGNSLVDISNPYRQILISGKEYNIFKLGPSATMSDKIYYVLPAADYWYVGRDYPVSPITHPELITPALSGEIEESTHWKGLNEGWHVIANLENVKLNNQHLFEEYGSGYSYTVDFGYEDVEYYMVVPKGSKFKDAVEAIIDVTENKLGLMEIDGKQYDSYKFINSEFAYKIFP